MIYAPDGTPARKPVASPLLNEYMDKYFMKDLEKRLTVHDCLPPLYDQFGRRFQMAATGKTIRWHRFGTVADGK